MKKRNFNLRNVEEIEKRSRHYGTFQIGKTEQLPTCKTFDRHQIEEITVTYIVKISAYIKGDYYRQVYSFVKSSYFRKLAIKN